MFVRNARHAIISAAANPPGQCRQCSSHSVVVGIERDGCRLLRSKLEHKRPWVWMDNKSAQCNMDTNTTISTTSGAHSNFVGYLPEVMLHTICCSVGTGVVDEHVAIGSLPYGQDTKRQRQSDMKIAR